MRLSVCAAPHAGRPRARSRCSTVNGDADPVLVAARSPPSAHDVEPAGARRSAIWLLGRLQADLQKAQASTQQADSQPGPRRVAHLEARLIAAHITFIYPGEIPGARAYLLARRVR
jgi:hypothetical protein